MYSFEKYGIHFYNTDCLPALREMPDNAFDLAIVDPPYGDALGGDGSKRYGGMFQSSISNGAVNTRASAEEQPVCRTGGTWASKYEKRIVGWDVAPTQEYFDELFRVSRNQVIFGGNYFTLPPSRCFVVYRKLNIPPKGFTMSPVEYAWTSFNRNAVLVEANSQSFGSVKRFHPTQKPVSIYKDLLEAFANKGDKILDTHVGSASSLLACYEMGFEVEHCA